MKDAEPPTPCSVVLVAAGKGRRFGRDKVWLSLEGRPLWMYPLLRFLSHPFVTDVILVVHPNRVEEAQRWVANLPSVRVVAGGEERQDSVVAGIRQASQPVVLVHDAARAWVSLRVVDRLLSVSDPVVVPVLPIPDTLRMLHAQSLGEEIDRERVVRIQTPQKVIREIYLKAYAQGKGRIFRDESTLIESTLGYSTQTVPGDERMFKITYPEDLERFQRIGFSEIRVGTGFDRHRLIPGEGLMLGGLFFPASYGVDAHSDGDVVLHALVDALLGTLGRGDIGERYPDTDPRFAGSPSDLFLRETLQEIHREGLWVVHVDCTVFLQRPKLASHKVKIREHLARLLGLDPLRVNLKAKTGEGVGVVGKGEAIEAFCSVVVRGSSERMKQKLRRDSFMDEG